MIIAISGCPRCFYHFGRLFDVADVDFVTWITTILSLKLFCHISQHDHKISPVSKKSHVFDVIANNFWCTDWRPDCCILYPLHIQEKSRKDSAQCLTEIFNDLKTELGAFYPKRNTRDKNDSIFNFNEIKTPLFQET